MQPKYPNDVECNFTFSHRSDLCLSELNSRLRFRVFQLRLLTPRGHKSIDAVDKNRSTSPLVLCLSELNSRLRFRGFQLRLLAPRGHKTIDAVDKNRSTSPLVLCLSELNSRLRFRVIHFSFLFGASWIRMY